MPQTFLATHATCGVRQSSQPFGSDGLAAHFADAVVPFFHPPERVFNLNHLRANRIVEGVQDFVILTLGRLISDRWFASGTALHALM